MIPVWIVGGAQRTGMSMMMRAIQHTSTLTPYKSDVVDQTRRMRPYHDDYDPNPNGFYEALQEERNDMLWPSTHEGQLVKSLLPDLIKMPAGKYFVVFMKRDIREIVVSMKMAFSQDVEPKLLEQQIEVTLGVLNERRDVILNVLNYSDVIENPVREFGKLAMSGWPVNPSSVAEWVDPALYRINLAIHDADHNVGTEG